MHLNLQSGPQVLSLQYSLQLSPLRPKINCCIKFFKKLFKFEKFEKNFEKNKIEN